MKTVNMHEAKSTLSALVRDLRDGVEPEVVICVAGRAAARLVPVGEPPGRELGVDRGLVTLSADFDEPNERITALFEDR